MTENLNNIDKFNLFAGKILNLCLSDFPNSRDIDALTDILKDEKAGKEIKGFVVSSVKALKRFGFIDFKDVSEGVFYEVALSFKSYEAFSREQDGKPLSELLSDSVKLGKDEAVINAAKAIMRG